MLCLNRVTLIGHLGHDPKVSNFPDGSLKVSLSVATSTTWKDKTTGEVKSETQWTPVIVTTPGLAQFAKQYFQKGSPVYVEGNLKTRSYKDKSSQADKYITEVVVAGLGGKLIGLGGVGKPSKEEDTNGYDEFINDELPY